MSIELELSASDITALRTCDSLTFFYSKIGDSCESGLHIVKEKSTSYPWEQSLIIKTKPITQCYEIEEATGGRYISEASYGTHDISGEYCYYPMATIIKLLRKNDVLSVRWVAGNNNQYTTESGLYNDQLFLEVWRGSKLLSFMIASSIGGNNSARMCHTRSVVKS